MESAVTREVCKVRKEQVDKDLDTIFDRMDKHEADIGDLQQKFAASNSDVVHLCKSVESLSCKIDKILEQNRNMMITVLTLLTGFFLFIIQQMAAGHFKF